MKLKSDTALEEIYAIRRQISQEHDHDLRKLLAHYKQMENDFKDRITPVPGQVITAAAGKASSV